MSEQKEKRAPTLTGLEDDIKSAMRAKDSATLGVLRYVKSQANARAKPGNGPAREVSNADILWAVGNQITGIRDKERQAGGLSDKDKAELALLEQYVPSRMTHTELKGVIEAILGETEDRSPKVRGFVNAELNKRHAGQYDKAQVGGIMNDLLKA